MDVLITQSSRWARGVADLNNDRVFETSNGTEFARSLTLAIECRLGEAGLSHVQTEIESRETIVYTTLELSDTVHESI